MTTDKKAQSNRLNAQRSTGPKTEAGKEACAGNAVKHGLTARKYLRRDEDPAELTPIYEALCATYEPKDAVMRDLVMKMAMCYLRGNRGFIAEAEHSPLADMLLGDHDSRVKNLVAYQTMVRKDLQFYERALAEHKKAWDARQERHAGIVGSTRKSSGNRGGACSTPRESDECYRCKSENGAEFNPCQ